MNAILDRLLAPVTLFSVVLTIAVLVLGLVLMVVNPKLISFMFKNLRRNPRRTGMTAAAILAFAVMIIMIWTIVFFLDRATREQAEDVKIIVTEKWQLPSQLPMTHSYVLDPSNSAFLPKLRGKYGPKDFMTWTFYGGSLDPKKMAPDTIVFVFAMNPDHIKPMMDDLQDLDDKLVQKLRENRQGVLIGPERLTQIKKQVGDRIKLTSFNYKDVDLELDIVGTLPDGRWAQLGIINAEYFNRGLDDYKNKKGKVHEMADRSLNLIWLRVRDQNTFSEVAQIIQEAPEFASRPVKVETASSGIASFIDAYRDLLWGMKWLMVPAILISMALIVANAIAITVRERFTEMAVLKVLGFQPGQIQILVLGEALLVGGIAGVVAGGLTWSIVNLVYGGIKFPIAFFPAFTIPWEAFFWGAAMGLVTGLLGSFLPAWSARTVKVSEVFSKVG